MNCELKYQSLGGIPFSIASKLDLSLLKVHPMLDPLRDHPRFQALVEKVFGPKR
jgi:hypothetical protein